MRKRNIKFTADTIFWNLLYLFPLITLVFGAFSASEGKIIGSGLAIDYQQFFLSAFNLEGMSVIGQSLLQACFFIFDFNNQEFGLGFFFLIYMMDWFGVCWIFHLFIDFILFIPRLAHKWLSKAYQDD